MEEVRVMVFSNELLVNTNSFMPDHLQLASFPMSATESGVALLDFLYSVTYIGSLESFDQEAIRDLPIISMIVVDGIVLKVNSDNSIVFFAEGTVNLTPYEGETFILLPDSKFTVDILGETTTIRSAESTIDLATAPNITPQMMMAFSVYNVKSWSQLGHIDWDTWLAFGGVNDFDAYQDTVMYAAAEAQEFWNSL